MRWLFGRLLKVSGLDGGTVISDGITLCVVCAEEDSVVIPERRGI